MLSEDVVSPPNPVPRHSPATSPRKKTHRKTTSALHLSSDTSRTASTLPEYSQTPGWEAGRITEDSPPDYPGTHRSSDSAEEADEETELTGSDDDEHEDNQRRNGPFDFVPQYTSAPTSPHFRNRAPLTASPRRPKRFGHQQQQYLDVLNDQKSHKRRHSSVSAVLRPPTTPSSHKQTSSLSLSSPKSKLSKSQKNRDTDSYLDSLLERSVHALEISNTLLQSSMSTQATMSALFSGSTTSLGAFKSSTTPPQSQGYPYRSTAESSNGTPTRSYYGYHDVDSALEARAIGLSSKLMRNWDVQESWAQQLENIKNGVDSLLEDHGDNDQEGFGFRHPAHSRQSTLVSPTSSHSLPNASPLSTLRLSNTASSSPTRQQRKLSIGHFREVDGSEDGHRSLEVTDMRGEVQDVHPSRSVHKVTEEEANSLVHAQLRLAPQDRSNLVSPPPRALTMYIDAISSPSLSQLEDSLREKDFTPVVLPSTLGVRIASASATSLLLPPTVTSTAIALPPQVTETVYDPSTPAYNMLSSLAARTGASSSTSNLLATISMPSSLKVPITPRRNSRDAAVASSAPSSFVSSFINRAAVGMRKRSSSPSDLFKPSQPRRASSADRSISPSVRRLARPPNLALPVNVNTSPNPIGPSHPSLIRRMTPPTEEESQTEGSGSSSDGFVAKRTVLSLRKILDEQQPVSTSSTSQGNTTTSNSHLGVTPGHMKRSTSFRSTRSASQSSRSSSLNRQTSGFQIAQKRPPAFMPRSPAPIPSAGTSTATASVSRLFTKNVHTSSTRQRSPLRSVMKGKAPRTPEIPQDSNSNTPSQLSAATASLTGNSPNPSGAPTPSPSLPNFPEFITRALGNGSKSASSSGWSTPKRISFAELPESYASTKPEGESSGMYSKRRSSGKRKSGGLRSSGSESSGLNVRRPGSPDESDRERSWWSSWWSARSVVEDRERMYQEDRATRAWGGRMGMALGVGGHPGMDDWSM